MVVITKSPPSQKLALSVINCLFDPDTITLIFLHFHKLCVLQTLCLELSRIVYAGFSVLNFTLEDSNGQILGQKKALNGECLNGVFQIFLNVEKGEKNFAKRRDMLA